MQASAGFVSASALGMACGPALAGLLQTNFKIYKLTFNQDTLPGWVMTVAWLIYLIWLWITFKEPSREIEENQTPDQSNAGTVLILQHLPTDFYFFYCVLARLLICISLLISPLSANISLLTGFFLFLEFIGFSILKMSPLTLVIFISDHC